MFSFLPFVLLLLASAAGYTKTSSFLGQTRNLTIMVSNDPNSRVTVAESGAAEIVFSNDMYASKGFDASDATKQPIGEEQGSCITVAGGNASCSWTNSFDNQGSITVQGKWLYNVSNSNDQFEYGILAITGGTGSYIGAAGEVRVNCPEESEPSLAFCTYDFGWRSLFQSSDGEVDESSEDNENNNNEVEVTPTAAQADAAETDADAVATSAQNTASTVAGSAESTTGTAADAAEADTSAVAAGAENTASTAAGSAENTANNAAAAAMGNPAPAVPGVPGAPGV